MVDFSKRGGVRCTAGEFRPLGETNEFLESKAMSGTEKVAAALVVVSCLLYAAIFTVPFFVEETTSRVGISGGLVLGGEGAFWLGALIAGPAVMRRYRGKLFPKNWRRQESPEQPDSNRAA